MECYRVLNNDGELLFYNYTKHKNFIKKFGISIESILLNFFQNFNYKTVKVICYILSPIVLIFFSYPSLILKLFGSKSFYKKFPLWWGRTPFNVILDLTDRLYAPINTRLNKNEMEKLLIEVGFKKINVIEVRDGLFIKVSKT